MSSWRPSSHVLAAVDHLENARRYVEQRMPVRVAGFQQQYPCASADETRGDATGGATSHDDMTESLFHADLPPFGIYSRPNLLETLPVELDAVARAGRRNSKSFL